MAAPGEILQFNPNDPTATPLVRTLTPTEPTPLTSPTLDAASAAVGATPTVTAAGHVIGQERTVGATSPIKLSLQLSVPLVALACGAHAMAIDPFGAAKAGFTTVNALAGNADEAGDTAQLEMLADVLGLKLVAVAAMLPRPDADRIGAVPVGGA